LKRRHGRAPQALDPPQRKTSSGQGHDGTLPSTASLGVGSFFITTAAFGLLRNVLYPQSVIVQVFYKSTQAPCDQMDLFRILAPII